jgi:hypothetical protein
MLTESVTWSDDEPEAGKRPPKPGIRPVDYDRLGAPISRRAAAGLPGLGKRR